MLLVPRYLIELAVFQEPGTGLMVMESNSVFHALEVKVHDPGIIAGPCIRTGFPSCRNRFNDAGMLLEELPQADPLQHGFDHDGLMPDRQRKVYRQALLDRLLVFACNGDLHVFPAAAPVGRQAFFDPFRTFGDHKKRAVVTCPYHIPGIRPPGVCVLMKEVGGEAGINHASGRHFVEAFIPAGTKYPDRQAVALGLSDDGGVFSHFFIAAEHIAMQAAGTGTGASVPGIPRDGGRLSRIFGWK